MKRLLAIVLSALLTATAAVTVSASPTWESKVDSAVLDAAARGNTSFIVYLGAKADLEPANLLADKAAKGRYVYDALTQTAARSQGNVISTLTALGREHRSFWITNAIVTSGDLDTIQAVASLPDVEAVYAVGKGELQRPVDPPTGTQSVSATTVVGPSIGHVRANEAWALGYRGQGVVVAGADTGVRWTHSAIKRQYRGFDPATGTADHDYSWHNAAGPNAACPADETQPCDDSDHGTHTVGTIVGDDGGANQVGVAPEAEWIACRNMNQGFGVVPTYMDCMQWFIAPTDLNGQNPDPSKAPDVVNNSWGCVEACAPPLLRDMVEASRAAGIFYVVSAGNDNQFFFGATMACNTINFPLAVYDAAFTVGSTEATADRISYFSSLGPVADNVRDGVLYKKPDIVAPGSNIRSATAASDTSYASLSGTSMAGPHVAGLVALIISANPSLRGHVSTIERVIRQSAKPLTSTRGCGGDGTTEIPNNEFGWGRIDALAAVQLALQTTAPIPEGDRTGEPLDPAHNVPIPCELISSAGNVPRSAKNLVHVANVCEFAGTDLEFQSRTDADGNVHDYAFVGTMGAGTRIFDVTDPALPRFVGGYADPGWQNDVSVFGDTLVLAFDPLGGPIHLSDCLKAKNPTSTRGGVDVVNLRFDPVLAALKAPLTFQTERIGCYLNQGGGAHTITIHPSGQWLSVNTSSGNAIEVVDLRSNALSLARTIPSSVAHSAHDVFFSRDGNTMYSAGLGSTRIVDVSDIFNRDATLIANISNNPSAAQGADGHVIQLSHQSDTTSDGRVLIVTDEKGGGLSQTSCNTTPTGNNIGGASFWALQSIAGVAKSSGATVTSPLKMGTWIYPNPGLSIDPLDQVLAGLGRTERACTIHVFRAGGNAGMAPATPGVGVDGFDGVSRLPVNEIVSAHYGAGVWHIDVMAAPGQFDDSRTTWGRTLGWNVMPGAETWSAKEYKGHIYAGDMTRGFDVYSFAECDGIECVSALDPNQPPPSPSPTPGPTASPTASPTATPTATPTPTVTPTPTATPTPTGSPSQCVTTTWSDDLEPAAHPDWRSGTDANQLSDLSPTWSQAIDTGAHSPTHSWSNDAKSLGLKDTVLVAPTQKIGRDTRLSFWHRYFTEEGYDGGVLEVSVDAGLTWRDVTAGGTFVGGGYNGTISSDFGSAIAGRNAWTGGAPTARIDDMTRVEVTLGGFVPSGKASANALIRWRYAGDELAVGALPGDEWWIDDIEFSNVVVSCSTATPTPSATATPAPTPTPQPTATPTAGPGTCTAEHVYFMGVVYDSALREDFQADVRNFEYYLSRLRETYCIPDSQATILAMGNNWTDPQSGKTYTEASEANVKAELQRLGALASAHSDSLFFFFLSSHGIMYTNAGWTGGPSECPIDRTAGSLAGLKATGGETGELFDCELGTALTTNFAPTTRMFVFVDCSFCGGFSDSITAASGTISDGSVPRSSGIPAANRIVMTGCAITTECFGSTPAENGGVSYHHLRNVMSGGVAACDGWTVPGFPTAYGLDVPVQGPPVKALDGKCTASEWFFGAVWSAYSSVDVIGIQQQFRIKYGMPSLADDILILE